MAASVFFSIFFPTVIIQGSFKADMLMSKTYIKKQQKNTHIDTIGKGDPVYRHHASFPGLFSAEKGNKCKLSIKTSCA